MEEKISKIIALEEHFSVLKENQNLTLNTLSEKLTDIGDKRIADMNEAGIDIQVLSLSSPGTEQMEPEEAVKTAALVNDYIEEAIKRNPSRLAAFAALPTSAPDRAADELERAVKEYGFKGAVINGHCRGRYLDDKFFWPILERAELLNVPLYIHPTVPPKPVVDTYYKGQFSNDVMFSLSTAGWGWHIETAVHVLRLILSGAFDRYPKLQIIVGHLGEAIPFMMNRLDKMLPENLTGLEKKISSYLCENVNYTISGFNFVPPFLNLLLQVGIERIMFSSDYPYSSMSDARSFLESLPLSKNDKEKIAHMNAERLMKF